MRWALIAVFTLAALGAWGLGYETSTTVALKVEPMVLPRVAMRPLPELGKAVTVAKVDVPAAASPTPAAAALVPAAAAAAKTPAPEPVAAAAPTPVAAAAPPPAAEKKEAPRPVARPAAAAPAPRPSAAADDAPAPAPRAAAKEKPADEAPAAAASGAGEGALNLKASDTAEIVIDGRKVGPSPKLGFKVKSGKHKIRFDCYDENGNLKAGKVQTVEVGADAEVEVSYDCPFTQ